MKLRFAALSLMVAGCWSAVPPLWAGSDEAQSAREVQQYRSMTEELMVMLKETMGIIRSLDHAPTAEEKKQLSEMMARLDAMLQHQQRSMQDIRDQLDIIKRQQDDFMDRQQILRQQQEIP